MVWLSELPKQFFFKIWHFEDINCNSETKEAKAIIQQGRLELELLKTINVFRQNVLVNILVLYKVILLFHRFNTMALTTWER